MSGYLYSPNWDPETERPAWDAWPIIKTTAKKVYVQASETNWDVQFHAIDRAALERDGFARAPRGSGAGCFYTKAGKLAARRRP